MATTPVDRIGSGEDVGRGDARRADALQLGGEHVEEHLGVGARVQVPAILAHQNLGQLAGVG
jgi:hypothetical protein